MASSNPAASADLEFFREQWRAEVSAKQAKGRQPRQIQQAQPSSAEPSTSVPSSRPRRPSRLAAKAPVVLDVDEDSGLAQTFDGTSGATQVDAAVPPESLEPAEEGSALNLYERAVEREAQGSLGDSLQLYRKAFRLNAKVDQEYKAKHFAAAWAPKAHPPPSAKDRPQQPAPAQESIEPLTTQHLISSFSTLSIQPAPAVIAGDSEPPCPIAELPAEILIHILEYLAIVDVGDFVRLARVCKRLAWLVSTEDRIWRRVCLGNEFGFAAMQREWQQEVSWASLPRAYLDIPLDEDVLSSIDADENANLLTNTLLSKHHASSWQQMFRSRPRIRFNGCYISTVNYIRTGQANVHSITWNSPVHIVTYYRYLRFFRDGTAISLLTVDEPAAVVHHLTKEALTLHKDKTNMHLPSAPLASAFRGRWKLSQAEIDTSDPDNTVVSGDESDLTVETEGIGSKYMYSMELSLRSAGKASARNNKLVWRGFYSYNRLTDDWAEFGLKNDKPFFFSRVKSYGVMGE